MAAVLMACGAGPETGQPGVISGTITSEAPIPPGPLSIAVYGTFPPSGPPLRAMLVERFELPYRYRIADLRPGRYHVGALIDVDRMDRRYVGMLNAERDPYGYARDGQAIVVDEREGAPGTDIQLRSVE